MANTLIRVEPELLEDVANKILEIDGEYEQHVLNLYAEVDRLQVSWSGKDNTAYTNQIRSYQKTLINISEVLKQYAQCLKACSRTYRETQDENTVSAGRL